MALRGLQDAGLGIELPGSVATELHGRATYSIHVEQLQQFVLPAGFAGLSGFFTIVFRTGLPNFGEFVKRLCFCNLESFHVFVKDNWS